MEIPISSPSSSEMRSEDGLPGTHVLPQESTSPATSPANTTLSTSRAILLVATATLAMLGNVANETTFSVAMATIQKELHLKEYQLQWINSAYPLSSGCLLLVFGRLADVYGRKKTFISGSCLLSAFTIGCAFPNDVMTLDILRGFQGIGAAAQIPAALGILAHTFPPSRARSFAFATFSAGAPIGAVLGSLLGGILTQYTKQTWRSSCYLLTGVTSMATLGGLISIPKDVPSLEADRRVDWLGAFLVTAGLVLIVFVLSQGETAPHGWATPYIIALLVLGVLLVLAFLYWQHYLERIQADPTSPYSIFTPPPLLRLSLWKGANGRLGAMMVLCFTNWCCFIAFTYWLQLYYQNYKLYTPIQTVIRFLPIFISGLVCNLFIALTVSRIPLAWLVGIGTLSTSTACLLFAFVLPEASYWAFGFPAAVLTVLGAGFLMSAGSIFIAKFALPQEQSVAGALFNTMTQLGTVVGVTVTTVVFQRLSLSRNIPPLPEPENGGSSIVLYRAAMWTGFAFGAVGMHLSLSVTMKHSCSIFIATILGVIAFRGVGVVGDRRKTEDEESDLDVPTYKKEQEIIIVRDLSRR